MLTIKNLSFGYDKNTLVLQDINLEIDGGFTFLIGENGSGKTTLIRNLTKDLKGTGSIAIDDTPVTAADYCEKLSYLPQEFDVYPDLRVREILIFIARLKGVDKTEVGQQVAFAAQKTQIVSYMDKKLKKCSQGMRRRVGIAAALLGSPQVVILDEPTAGIDPQQRLLFYQTIKECFPSQTVLLSTHILDDIDILADHVIMLSQGKITFAGSYQIFKNALNGRLFELVCTNNELTKIMEQYQVLSYTRTVDGKNLCRMVCAEQIPNATAVEPSLQDLWQFYQGATS